MTCRSAPWRILVDGTHIRPDQGGVGSYTINLLEHFPDDGSIDTTVLLLEQTPAEMVPCGKNTRVARVAWRNHLWHGLLTIPGLSRRRAIDAVLVPYETPVGPFKKPLFFVCHDVPALLRQAQSHEWKAPGRRAVAALDDRLTAMSLRRARGIFNNSEFVGNWLADEVGVSRSRLHSAPCAPGANFERAQPERLRAGGPGPAPCFRGLFARHSHRRSPGELPSDSRCLRAAPCGWANPAARRRRPSRSGGGISPA